MAEAEFLERIGNEDNIKQSVFIMVYFSDVFNIDEGLLDDYGAFNISLLNDMLKQNLKNPVKIYEAANNANQSIKVILYFTEKEKESVLSILEELKLQDDENIILIDACDNKSSASNVK